MGKISSFTELDTITSGDMFIVTDDTTTNSRKISYDTIKSTLFSDDIELTYEN